MRGLGYVSVALIKEALQNVGRDANILPPFSEADLAFLNHPGEPGNPASYWERTRGAVPYGPGASGPYSWMNDPNQWTVSAQGTEILNLNRDIIRGIPVFSSINWNDPRIRLPESYAAAAMPVPELPSPVAPITTGSEPAPVTQPYFTPTSGPLSPTYSGSPIYDPSALDYDGLPNAAPVQAGFSLSNLPGWAKIALGVAGVFLAMPIIAPGFKPGRNRRR